MINSLRPNKSRAKIAILFIWIAFSMDLISLGSDFLEYQLLSSAASGNEVTEEAASLNDIRQLAIGLLYFIVAVVSGITFIMWFRRAYYNLEQKITTDTSNGWAAGAWFVPFICLFRPYQIMKELYTKTFGILMVNNAEHRKGSGSFPLIGLWWALWIIDNFIGNFVLRYSFKSDTIDSLMDLSVASMCMSVVGLVLAPVTVKVIKDYSEMEELMYQLPENQVVTTTSEGAAGIPEINS